jgi:hypothetical protein
MKQNGTLFALVVAVGIMAAGLAYSSEQSPFSVNKDGRITAQADSVTLSTAVRDLSRQLSFEVKGMALGNDAISLDLSNVTLDDLLKRMLRGYNYALIRPENADRAVLMILGKASRAAYTAPAPPPASAPTPTASTQTNAASQPQASRVAPGVQSAPRGPTGPSAPGTVAGGTGSGAGSSSSAAIGGSQMGTGQSGVTDASLTPPMPPAVAGLDMPPMPPAMPAISSAFGGSSSTGSSGTSSANTATGASASASQTSPSQQTSRSQSQSQSQTQSGSLTPPQVPSSGYSQTVTQPSATDLRPPQIPFQ